MESTDSMIYIIIMGRRLLINAVRNAIVICNIIGANLSQPHTYHTAVQNLSNVYIYHLILNLITKKYRNKKKKLFLNDKK